MGPTAADDAPQLALHHLEICMLPPYAYELVQLCRQPVRDAYRRSTRGAMRGAPATPQRSCHMLVVATAVHNLRQYGKNLAS